MRHPQSIEDRFWPKVQAMPSGCWEWQASCVTGYGQFWIGRRADGTARFITAHRFTYELLVGPVPEGLQIDHLCRNRGCVNPTHAEPVTQRENFLRGESPSARVLRSGMCKRGHRLTMANSYARQSWQAKGWKSCKECGRLRLTSLRARRRALALRED